jgi:hypothetical protein
VARLSEDARESAPLTGEPHEFPDWPVPATYSTAGLELVDEGRMGPWA